jgi:hypothetical protein
VLYIRPTDLFHFSPSAKAEFLACRAFPFSRMDESAWHYLRRTILSFAARAFTAWSVRFNFAAIRRIDVLASIKDLRRSSSSRVHPSGPERLLRTQKFPAQQKRPT